MIFFFKAVINIKVQILGDCLKNGRAFEEANTKVHQSTQFNLYYLV